MLDHLKVMKAFQHYQITLFSPLDDELAYARILWQRMISDEQSLIKLKEFPLFPLVQWKGKINDTFSIAPLNHYKCIGIDGSQIYPDRHITASCALINIGIVSFDYTMRSNVRVQSDPTLLLAQSEPFGITTDCINARRHEFELAAAAQLSPDDSSNAVVLFDGSLIAWHLQGYDERMRAYFLAKYNHLLMQLYQKKCWSAWYISFPKSKELVNLLRTVACNYQEVSCDASELLERILDSHVASFFLKPFMRTTLFEHQSAVSSLYEEPVRPWFFYIDGGEEIARVEIPAWIAQSDEMINHIAAVILDQMKKGYGYPISLSEAHEQAVVKGPDREMFYHLLEKYGLQSGYKLTTSQKSAKKRRMNV